MSRADTGYKNNVTICLEFQALLNHSTNNTNTNDNVYNAVIMARSLGKFTWFINECKLSTPNLSQDKLKQVSK